MPAFCSSSRTIWRIRWSAIALRLEPELDSDPRVPEELLPVPPDDVPLLLEPGVVAPLLDEPDVPPLTCAKAVPPKASKAARVQVFDRCFFIITPCVLCDFGQHECAARVQDYLMQSKFDMGNVMGDRTLSACQIFSDTSFLKVSGFECAGFGAVCICGVHR
jgi:hypothetical protein